MDSGFGRNQPHMVFRQSIVFTNHKPLVTEHCRVQKHFVHSAPSKKTKARIPS